MPRMPYRRSAQQTHMSPGWRFLDRLFGDGPRFRRLLLLLLVITVVTVEPGAVPELLLSLTSIRP